MSRYEFLVTSGIVDGTFWTLTYVLIIVRGLRDRTWSMPPAAMCANLTWELVYSFVQPPPVPQVYVNRVWFVFDVVILLTYLRYWRSDYPANLSARWAMPMLGLMLACAFGAVYLSSLEFHDRYGLYAGFGQDWMMSILFVTMFLRRNSLSGQSFYIALFKTLGSAAAAVGFAVYLQPTSVLLDFLYVATLLVNVVYLVAVYRKCRELGVNPWTDLARARALQPRLAATGDHE